MSKVYLYEPGTNTWYMTFAKSSSTNWYCFIITKSNGAKSSPIGKYASPKIAMENAVLKAKELLSEKNTDVFTIDIKRLRKFNNSGFIFEP